MKTCYSICLACLLTTFSFCQQQDAPVAREDGYLPRYTASQLLAQLEKIAPGNQKDSLREFFRQWHSSIPAMPAAYINQNDTIRAIYDVYRSFYRPLRLPELGEWELGNSINEKAAYVVVTTAINYLCVGADSLDVRKYEDMIGTNEYADSIKTLFDFRPTVDVDSSRVLYFTGEYQTALNRFMGNEYFNPDKRGFVSPSLADSESDQRYALLRPYIPILHGNHRYWYLETHPEVSLIVFNRSLTQAVVIFQVYYQGGGAVLRNINGKWKLEKSRATWIE